MIRSSMQVCCFANADTGFVQQKRYHRILSQNYLCTGLQCGYSCLHDGEEICIWCSGGLSGTGCCINIDFCMKLKGGYWRIIHMRNYTSYESKSRGPWGHSEKVARFNKEIATFEKKWPEILKNGRHPYYNPNLTLKSQDFSEKNLKMKSL